MKALVINLATESARMAFMADQLHRLGIEFERLEATTPASLSPDADDPYWTLWERPMRRTEMAALASHRAAWQRVADGSVPMLILEDDAVLMGGTRDFLSAISGLPEAEMVTLETRGRRKLIARDPHPKAPMHHLWQDRTGAAAYVLQPDGARKLLARVTRAPGLADGVLCAAYEIQTWQAVPALACQLDRCAAEGMVPPMTTDSAIGREPRPENAKSAAQIFRRLGSQFRMGVRRIRRAIGSENVIVPLAKD